MRPLKLIMQAFGPYAKKEEIDFTNLGNRTMFVISGKTGAGKTTIFDGISFAIYGKASGEDRNGAELRSQFAEDDLLTEVSLEFSLRDKTYYIWRSPQQEKKKARGEGYTTVGAKAELYVINGDGKRQLLAANVRDADEKIKEIIQLDANQFRQILMIPQGEFRKLLISDSKDKEVILQRLFHTELYKLIEEKLKEEASTIKNMIESKVDERSQHLRSIYVNDNEALTELLGQDTLNIHTILPLLSEQIVNMKEQLDNITKEYEDKKKNRDEAKKSLDEASALLLQFENMNLLKKKKNELLEQKSEIEGKKIEIENAYKASRLEQQDLLCHRLKKEYDAALKEYNHSEFQLKEAIKSLEIAEKQYKQEEEKTEKRQELADELYKLTNLKEEVYSFAERKMEVVRLEKEQQKLVVEEGNVKENLRNKEKEIDAKRINQKSLADLTMRNFEMEKELERVISIKQKLNKLKFQVVKKEDIITLSESKRILFENVQQRLQDAKNTFVNIEHQWQAGQAGLLAQKLIEGNPCPVCGSLEHPNPNSAEGEIPNEKDLEAAKNDVDQIEEERSKVETDWLETKATHASIASAIKEQSLELNEFLLDFSLENLELFQNQYEDKYSKLSRSIQEQKKKLEYIPQLEKELQNLEILIKQYRNDLESIQEKQKMITQEYIGKKTAVENSILNIPEDIRTKEQYNHKLNRITQEKQQLEKAFEIASKQVQLLKEKLSGLRAQTEQLDRSVKKAEDSLKKERERFISMLEEQGFSGYHQFSQSKKTDVEIKQLEQYVQFYGEELRSVSDRYQDISERLANIEQPNVDLLKQQFHEIEHQLLKMNEEQTNMKMNIRHNENIIDRVMTINETIKDAEQQYQLVGHLADISRGQNTYRITFERYVLAAFLDDILYVANSRLTKMTSGRYHLLRKKDRSKGNVQSGLELLIFDQYTGQERHVKTLSGGESFKAALALALGLADVVQQYAGGVSLETMFIDEGFGTLDPESLDHAIEALMDIQSSGRLVGIISHVPELKERIDARLEVISGQNGSRTEFQFFG